MLGLINLRSVLPAQDVFLRCPHALSHDEAIIVASKSNSGPHHSSPAGYSYTLIRSRLWPIGRLVLRTTIGSLEVHPVCHVRSDAVSGLCALYAGGELEVEVARPSPTD